MATTTALKAADGDAAAEPKKKKSKKKLIIIVVAVLLLGGGGYFMFGKKKPVAAPKPGAVVAMEAITINLTGGHFLKLGLAIQATAVVKEVPDGSKALDLAIAELSNRSVAELSTNKARETIKAELKEKVIEAYEGEVMDLFFTEFVMQ
ncbi:MAG TPA: flagellar basal body-associated FliL family protein [Mycobacteriales bacterium]|nr:flagellar basal body-associated FliL family protein [Mycobacteriales bacterium]